MLQYNLYLYTPTFLPFKNKNYTMEIRPSEQQELLLLKACREYDGRLPMSLAKQLYSSGNSAKNAITKLEALGFIERTSPGYWKVVKVTDDVRDMVKDDQHKPSAAESSENSVSQTSEEDFEVVKQ